jgi:hypothetical protein
MKSTPQLKMTAQSLKNPVVMHMVKHGIPLSRENYLKKAGLQEPLHWEQEQVLPVEFRKGPPYPPMEDYTVFAGGAALPSCLGGAER